MDVVKLINCIGFEWDHGNALKNEQKHEVTRRECEEVFLNRPLLMFEDVKHSSNESRCYVLGRTEKSRRLFIAFTIREGKIRVISARPMSKRERGIYEQAKKNP